jgi:hypothetical protein
LECSDLLDNSFNTGMAQQTISFPYWLFDGLVRTGPRPCLKVIKVSNWD